MKFSGVDALFKRSAVPVALLFLLGQGCTADPTPGTPDSGVPLPPDGGVEPPPPPGLPAFISADEHQYYTFGEEEEEEEEEEEDPVDDVMPSVQGESDLYGFISDTMLVNLHRFRGLQVIDMSNTAYPHVVGRLRLDAEPSSLLVTGNRAIVLANQRQRGKRVDVGLGIAEDRGGVMFLIDLSDRTAPRVVDTLVHEGSPGRGFLYFGNQQTFLYMTRYLTRRVQLGDGSTRLESVTMLESYRITGDSLVPVAQLELPDSFRFLRPQPGALLLYGLDFVGLDHVSTVSFLDISAGDGSVTQHGTITLPGVVESPEHMMFHDGMLRVFSGPTYFEPTSHLQIWNATDLDAPFLVDDETFGGNGNLYGVAMQYEDRAFAAVYHPDAQEDPFYAFAIDSAGNATPVSEFVVPEWNDLFHSVLGDSRLIGVSVDSINYGPEVATINLYDVTDLANPSPLVASVEVSGEGVGNALALATWNYEAVSVHEDIAAVQAPTGELETGMLLLPFESSWYENGRQEQHGAQIFTFSSTTITRRGLLLYSQFRRHTFHDEDRNLVGNVSYEELSLSDIGNVEQPTELGQVELMAQYTNILSFGDYRVRLKAPLGSFFYFMPNQPLEVQVIPSDEPADTALPVASFQLPFGTEIFKMGESLLVTVRSGFGSPTRIAIYDLTDPRQPYQIGELTTTAIPDLPTWAQRGDARPPVYIVGNALVLVNQIAHDEYDDTMGTVCFTSLTHQIDCGGRLDCSYASGVQTCQDFGEGTQYCVGGFAQCTDHGHAESTCEPRAADDLEGATPYTFCDPAQRMRYWRQLELFVVDLSDPAAPDLVDTLLLPADHDSLSAIAHGTDLYVSTKVPVTVPADPRPYAARYLTRIDLSVPTQPVVGPAINVPGELIAVHGDTLLLRDTVWGQQFVETALAQIQIAGDEVLLQRYHRFVDRLVGNVVSDDTGLVAAKHGQVWGRPWHNVTEAFFDKLVLMHMGPVSSPPGGDAPGFDVLSDNAVEQGPDPFLLKDQRLFLRNSDALQIIDVSNPITPVPKAVFQANGALINLLIENGELLIAADRWGILQFDLDTDNLLDATP